MTESSFPNWIVYLLVAVAIAYIAYIGTHGHHCYFGHLGYCTTHP
jgi:choline-glycine betaine transporter